MLFIRKSASNFEYLRQNLSVLSMPTGAMVETRYRTRWIDPVIVKDMPKAGQPVCILFADPPYEWHLPVRFAILKNDPYMNEDGSYVFQLTLDRFADISVNGPPDFGSPNSQGRDLFVFRNDDDLVQPSSEPDTVAWRWVIQNIVGFFPERGADEQPPRRLERYLSSFFFRSAGFKDDQADITIDPSVTPLQIGRSYVQLIDCYAPHIAPDRISQWELVGETEPAVADVLSVLATADGLMGMRVIPRLPGMAKIKVWVQPEQARSSQILIDCQVEGEAIQTADTALRQDATLSHADPFAHQQSVVAADAAGLTEAQTKALYHELLTSYERVRPDITDQERLDLATRLIPYAVEQRFLIETQGVCLFRQGMFDRAWSRFADLGLDRLREPEAVAGYFISGWSTGQFIDIHHFVQRSKGKQWGSSLLNQVRQALPWNQVMGQPKLMEDLYAGDVLDEEVLFDVLKEYSDGDFVAEQVTNGVKEEIVQRDAAYRFLLSWLKQSDQQTRRRTVARLAIDYGLEGGHLEVIDIIDTYGERIVQEAGLDQIVRWRESVEMAFSGSSRLILLERLAHAAAILDSAQCVEYAVMLLLEIAEEYTGRHKYPDDENLKHVGYCLEKARGLLTDESELEARLIELEKTWTQQAEQTEIIRDYLAQFDENRIERLKSLIKGKRVVLVGGLKQHFDPNKLAEELGLRSCEHVEVWGHKTSLDSLTTRIRAGHIDYVFDRTGFGSHRDEVRDNCKTARQNGNPVHYLSIYRSMNKRVIVETLWEYHFGNSEHTQTD